MYPLLTTKNISHLVRYDSPSSTLDASWLNRAISVKFWNTPCPFTALCGVNARVPISCGVASASKGLAWFVPKRNNWSELIKTVHTEKSGKESSLNSKIIPVCCRCCWPKQQRLVYDISFARSCRVCCSKTRLNGSVFITIFRAHSVWVAQHFFLPTSIPHFLISRAQPFTPASPTRNRCFFSHCSNPFYEEQRARGVETLIRSN